MHRRACRMSVYVRVCTDVTCSQSMREMLYEQLRSMTNSEVSLKEVRRIYCLSSDKPNHVSTMRLLVCVADDSRCHGLTPT